MINTKATTKHRPRKRQSYADQVSAYIKDQIMSGELQQGDKIAEEKIAEEFGVSRTPIREALTRLQAYGLVNIIPRSYAEVVSIGDKEAGDIAQLRLNLEQMAFRLLCKPPNKEAIEELKVIAEEARDALMRKDKAGYFEADSKFHILVADRCGNGQLSLMYHQFISKVQLLMIAQHVPLERLEIYMRQHFDIIEMLEQQRCSTIDELLKIHIVHDLANYEFRN